MAFFGLITDPRQARIDALVFENACLSGALETARTDLTEATRKNRELDALARLLRGQRDTAREERDGFRTDALKHRSSRSHLKQYQPKSALPTTGAQNGTHHAI